MKKVFTSESVTAGHPDKVCDQISDAILDACIKQDKESRVACETAINSGVVLVMGEITSNASINIEELAINTIKKIGYVSPETGFDVENCKVIVSIKSQSPDIAIGVNKNEGIEKEIGAGDQGMMFGYACNQTEEFMPMPIILAHRITKRLEWLRKQNVLFYLRPDGKAQVTIEYDKNNKPKRIDTIVISTQHNADVSLETIKRDMLKHIIEPCMPPKLIDRNTKIFINPTGRFVIGGPDGDSGLTGRKIIVDTYGGMARHGGGAFSGKDYTKVDRSAAYAARYIAKNVVASGLAAECEIQLAYAIGVSEPVSINVNTYGTGQLPDEKIADIISKEFSLTPEAIINCLDLMQPIYQQTASYGHFGRTDLVLPWERLDKVACLSSYIISMEKAV